MSIDSQVQAAFDRLIAGRPELGDTRLTVTSLCAEAGVSRASFYRSGQSAVIRRALSEAGNPTHPEVAELRAQVKSLQQAEKILRARHASEVRELRDTAATYANHIQLLALRVDQLEVDNRGLLGRLEDAGDNVTRLPARR